jgi:hypothetical protein
LGNQDESEPAEVSFGVNVEGPDTTINFQFSPGNTRGAVLRHGPQGTVCLYSFETNNDFDIVWHDIVPIRTCPRINVYLSEDFVLPAPSGYCQGALKRPRVPLEIQEGTTVIQTPKLCLYRRPQR